MIDRRTALKYAAAGVSALLPACRPAPPAPSRQQHSARAPRSLRVELRHTNGDDERFALTRLRAEPVWAGPAPALGAAPDWGDYRLDLTEAASGKLLYRTGFDGIADRGSAATLSVRAPYPDARVDLAIAGRRAGAFFQPLWGATIDPADPTIDASAPRLPTRVETLRQSGPASAKVDIAILGDGYAHAEYPKFVADARRAAEYLFSVEPFGRRASEFNVHAVFTASAQSGITDPYLARQSSTAFGCTYGAGAAERTLFAADEAALREAASVVPYDFLLVLANARRYGGSAYFGGPAVVSIDSASARYLVVHEFAHAFSGLADEYYIPARGGPAYAGNIEPWNPNVTLSRSNGKWAAPAEGVWNKAQYDRYFAGYVRRYFALRESRASEDRVERFMQAESRRQRALLGTGPRSAGFYEGANGFARGVYRSEADCIMFSLQTERFCVACRSAIDRTIDYHSAAAPVVR
jgi:hypothetical protein